MSARTRAALVVAVGRADDGVTAYALECAEVAGVPCVHVDAAPEGACAAVARALAGRVDDSPVHLHLTDRLFAADGRAAAAVLHAAAGTRPLVVTLHDVPQSAEGEERSRRRAGFYREVARRAAVVVVSSDHERGLCADLGIGVDAVVPLPLPDLGTDDVGADGPGEPGGASVGIFGYLHPGKAVDVAVDELCRLPDPPALHLLGRPSARSLPCAEAL